MLHFYLTGHQIELETCSAVPSVPVTIQLFKSEHRKSNFYQLAADRALPRRGGGRHILPPPDRTEILCLETAVPVSVSLKQIF